LPRGGKPGGTEIESHRRVAGDRNGFHVPSKERQGVLTLEKKKGGRRRRPLTQKEGKTKESGGNTVGKGSRPETDTLFRLSVRKGRKGKRERIKQKKNATLETPVCGMGEPRNQELYHG